MTKRAVLSIGLSLALSLPLASPASANEMWNLKDLDNLAIAVVQPQNSLIVSNEARAQLSSDIKAKLRGAGISVVPHESSKAILDINLQDIKTAGGEAILVQFMVLEGVTAGSRATPQATEATTYMDQELIEVSLTEADEKIHDVLVNELTTRFITQYMEQKSH